MHSASKPQDPFNFSCCTGVHAFTLHVQDFIYMLNSDKIFLELNLMIIENYAMIDLCNWKKNKTFYERYTHVVAKIEWVLWFQRWVHFGLL